ncbi:paramyosin isoform X1 [Canna indica]|uniref:Paramyosin isoform X1 n=1 Tax=Canna indica TaxID=4628 RepID=A0AAQ3JNF5_9LILI|nr:paramyosin isoform X1 [Canna indica]
MFNKQSELEEIGGSEASSWDRIHVDKLERELRNCYQEIEYLQDQLNLRNVEANFMAEHVQSLELKLAGTEKLNHRLKMIGDDLIRADSQCLILMKELKYKEEELRKSDLQIENLETLILDSQCEIETLKLDITALDQRCVDAERHAQQLAEEKCRMVKQLDTYETQLQEKQQVISQLENEKKKLQEKVMLFDRNAKHSSLEVEHDKFSSYYSEAVNHLDSQHDKSFLLKLREQLPSSNDICTSGDKLGSSLAKLAAVTSQDEHMKSEIEKMAKQINESELLVNQLKEELREVKLKAKEEAEDLIQEMAELRYQFTGMLEEESKRRALVEEASIRRVQDLEAQVRHEQKKYTTVHRRFEEVNEVAEKQSMEIRKLKHVLEKLHLSTNLESSQRNTSCCCGICSFRTTPLDIEAHVDDEALNA